MVLARGHGTVTPAVDPEVLVARVVRAISAAQAATTASRCATLQGSLECRVALRLRQEAGAVRKDLRRRRGHFFLTGAVGGHAVTATLCPQGLEVSPELLRQAELVVSLGERFPQQDGTELVASLEGPPLAVALTLIRACDKVDRVDLGSAVRAGHDDDPSDEVGASEISR